MKLEHGSADGPFDSLYIIMVLKKNNDTRMLSLNEFGFLG